MDKERPAVFLRSEYLNPPLKNDEHYNQITAVRGHAVSNAAAAPAPELTRTAWKMNKGKDVLELTKQVSVQTDTTALYERAQIPPAGDAGWINAPDPDVIGFGINGKGEHLSNSIVPEAKAFRSADYTYFETVVTKPAGVTVKEFKIVFDQMDDGSRVTIFNKDHPEGIVVEGS